MSIKLFPLQCDDDFAAAAGCSY